MNFNKYLNKSCNGWCVPTIIFAVLATLSFFTSLATISNHRFNSYLPEKYNRQKYRVGSLILHTVYSLIWLLVLYALCSKCYTNVAWILLILPFISGLLIIIVTLLALVRLDYLEVNINKGGRHRVAHLV